MVPDSDPASAFKPMLSLCETIPSCLSHVRIIGPEELRTVAVARARAEEGELCPCLWSSLNANNSSAM